jgi:hypothetical protein
MVTFTRYDDSGFIRVEEEAPVTGQRAWLWLKGFGGPHERAGAFLSPWPFPAQKERHDGLHGPWVLAGRGS